MPKLYTVSDNVYCILYSFLLSLKLAWRLIILLQEQRTGEKPGAEEHDISVLLGTYVVLDAIAVEHDRVLLMAPQDADSLHLHECKGRATCRPALLQSSLSQEGTHGIKLAPVARQDCSARERSTLLGCRANPDRMLTDHN